MIILAMFICESSMSQELGFVIINRNLEIQEFDNYMLIDSTVSRDMLMNPVEIEIINENICEVFFGYHDGLFGGEMINVIFNRDLEILEIDYSVSNGDVYINCSDGRYSIKDITLQLNRNPFVETEMMHTIGYAEVLRDHFIFDQSGELKDCKEYFDSDNQQRNFKFVYQEIQRKKRK